MGGRGRGNPPTARGSSRKRGGGKPVYTDLDKGEFVETNEKHERGQIHYGDAAPQVGGGDLVFADGKQGSTAGGSAVAGTAPAESDSVKPLSGNSASGGYGEKTPTLDKLNIDGKGEDGKPSKNLEDLSSEELERLAAEKKLKDEKAARRATEKQKSLEEKVELSKVLAPTDDEFQRVLKTWNRPADMSRKGFMDYVYSKDWGQSVRDSVLTE